MSAEYHDRDMRFRVPFLLILGQVDLARVSPRFIASDVVLCNYDEVVASYK